MDGLAKRTVKKWLRLPADPRPPSGSAESVQIFHPARGYFRYAVARWALRQVGVAIGFLFAFSLGHQFFDWVSLESKAVTEVLEEIPAWIVTWAERLRLVNLEAVPDSPETTRASFGPGLLWLEVLGVAVFLAQLPLSYAMTRLDYELRFYIVTDRSLRIREGITAVRESTMTFDNIQNIAIRQGPIQRLFGIADLRVRTAGGGSGNSEDESNEDGGGKDSMHVGYFRGVNNAQELRDTILTRLKSLKDAGLGAPSDAPDVDQSIRVIEAARRVLSEAREMKASLSS